MKLHTALFMGFLCLSPIFSFSQKATVQWGPMEKIDKNKGYIEPIGLLDGKFYTLRQKTNSLMVTSFYLEVVDKNMNIRLSKKLDLKDYFSPVVLFKDKKIYMYRLSIKETGASSVGLHEAVFDLNGRKLSDNLMTELEEIGRYNFNKVEQFLEVSPDGKHVGIVISREEFKEDKVQLTTIHVPIDNPEQYKSEILMIDAVEKANDADLTQVFVDNNGNILSCIGTADRNFNNPRKSDPYEYLLIPYNATEGYGTQEKLVFEGIYFDKLEIEKIGSDYFMTGMLLTRNKKRSLYNGFFLCKVDIQTAKLSSIQTFPYEIKFFEALGYKIKKDGRINFSGRFLLNLVDLEADGGYLIADHSLANSYERSETKELIAIPFSSEGELGSLTVLPKNQVGMGKQMVNAVGYFPFSIGNSLHIIYNDHLDNINITELEELKYANRPDDDEVGVFMASITEGESLKRQILYKVKSKKGAHLIPDKCYSKDGKVIIHVADRKDGQYGQVNVE